MEVNYLCEKLFFFNDDIDDFKMFNVVLLDTLSHEHLIQIFEYKHESTDGKFSYCFSESSIDSLNYMLDEYLNHEVIYIFDKAFKSYCECLNIPLNQIIMQEQDIRSTLVVKYLDNDIVYNFDEFLDFLKNEALKRVNLEIKFKFVKDIIFKRDNYNAFIYFLNINLNELSIKDIKDFENIDFTRNITFNPFLDSQQDLIRKINNIYYNMPTKGTKINKTKLISQTDRLKRIFDVYYVKYYLEENSLTNIYKILRERYGYIFNEFTLVNDFSDLENEAKQNKSHIKKDLEFIKNIKEVYRLLEY